jgi:geranylgeranyl reductase
MKHYDVVITGAGPAGLMCAESLSTSDLSVLLLEKNDVFGRKVCAGGLTRKDMALLDVPDEIIEYKVNKTAVVSRKGRSGADAPEPFLFTVNRVALGTWHKKRLEKTKTEIRINTKVTYVDDKKIIVNGEEEIGYKYLVGADGFFSVVRKYLGLPQEKKLTGIQYIIPAEDVDPRLFIYLDSKRFHAWYGWKFPHQGSYAVGCCADPKIVPPPRLKENFKLWLRENDIDVSNAEYQAYPISYDYRGYKFGNIFLAGEAAGLASGFTGEGIYQSLVSGQTVARTILDENYASEEMEAVLKYNRIQERILNFLVRSGPLKGLAHELIVGLLNNKRVKARIHRSFS